MKKKLLAAILALVLALSLLPVSALADAGAALSGTTFTAYEDFEFSADVTVTLTVLTFTAIEAGTDVSAWFSVTGLNEGRTAKTKTAVTSGATTATITISGTPTEVGTVTISGGSIEGTFFASEAAVIPTGSVTYTIKQPPTVDGRAIFANGNEIIIMAGSADGYTNILYDKDGDDTIEDTEYMKIGDDAPSDEGYDLSEYSIVGGCKDAAYTGNTNITMEGGKVADIIGGNYVTGTTACNLTGDVTINVTGGEVTDSLVGGCARMTADNAASEVTGDISVSLSGGSVGIVCAGSDSFTDTGTLDIGGGVSGVEVSGKKTLMILTDPLKDGKFNISGELASTDTTFALYKGMGSDGVPTPFTAADVCTVATASADVTIDLTRFSLGEASGVVLASDGTSLTIATRATALDLTSGESVSYKDADGKDANFTPATETKTITSSEGWTFIPDADSATEGDQPQLILSGLWLAVDGEDVLTLPADTTVVVNGTNTVICTVGCGISAVGNVTFTATGTLNVTGATHGISATGDIKITGGEVTARGTGAGSYGIYAEATDGTDATGAIKITGGKIEAEGTTAAMAAESIEIGSGMAITNPGSGEVKSFNFGTESLYTVLADSNPAKIVTFEPAPTFSGDGEDYYTPDTTSQPITATLGGSALSATATVTNGVADIVFSDNAQLTSYGEPIEINAMLGKGVQEVTMSDSAVIAISSSDSPLKLNMDTGSITAIFGGLITPDCAGTGKASFRIIPGGAESVNTADGKALAAKALASYDIGIRIGGEEVRQFNPGAVKVERAIGTEELEKAGIYTVDENGELQYVMTYLSGDVITFYPPHFSPFYLIEFPFEDVPSDAWFYEDAVFAYLSDLMNGTGDTAFTPHGTTTRAMVTAILYRLEGQPAVTGECPFDDVASGKYYEDAVTWAAANEIVDGYGNAKFGPEESVTREQMAAILYRYAQYKGYDVSVGEDTNILSYNDALDVGEYAIPAMQWACGAGLIEGSAGKLMPQGGAERCQVAAILHRFCNNQEK